MIARPNARQGCRRTLGNFPGFDTVICIQPGNAIVHQLKFASLLKIQEGKDHRRQRSQRQHDRPQTYPQILLHATARQGYTCPIQIRCKSETIHFTQASTLIPFDSIVSNKKSGKTERGYGIRKSRYGFLKPELSKLDAKAPAEASARRYQICPPIPRIHRYAALSQ